MATSKKPSIKALEALLKVLPNESKERLNGYALISNEIEADLYTARKHIERLSFRPDEVWEGERSLDEWIWRRDELMDKRARNLRLIMIELTRHLMATPKPKISRKI